MSVGFTPWTANVEAKPLPARGHWYVVLDDEENGIGEFYGEDHEANVANLHMAVAAPELYEALENIIIGISQGSVGKPAVLAGVAALAKARGEITEESGR